MTNRPTNNSANGCGGNTDGRTDGLTESPPTNPDPSSTFVPRTRENPIRPAELMRRAVAAGLAASRPRRESEAEAARKEHAAARSAARAEVEEMAK